MVDKKKSGLLAFAIATSRGGAGFRDGRLAAAPPARQCDRSATAPEIDAGSGLASVAVVIAALCLAWERRRRVC